MVDSFHLFLAALILFQGLGWTGVGPLVHTKLMVNWFSKRRGVALGIAIMGISVAGIVVPVVNAWLAETVGWRGAYAVYVGLLVAVVIPLSIFMVKQHPTDIGQTVDGLPANPMPVSMPAPPDPSRSLYVEFLTNKAYWSVILTFGLMNGVFSAMVTHLPNYMTTELSFDLYTAASLLTVAGVFAILGKLLFGWMMDALPAKAAVMTGVFAYLSSTVVLMLGENFPVIGIATALFGLGFGGMVPVRSVLISRIFGAAKFSRANGLLSFFIAPATFWVLITGYIADRTGSYVSAFQIWCVAFMLAGLVSLIVKLPNRDEAVA